MFGKGYVSWYCVLGLSIWRSQWIIWIDHTLQFAPNAGFGKATINLNTVWAAFSSTESASSRRWGLRSLSSDVASSLPEQMVGSRSG
jgi:hypothetical protein